MLYAGASHCTHVLQKYRWPSWQLGFQPPPHEHTHTAHRRRPRWVCPHPSSPSLLRTIIRHHRIVSASAQTHPRRLNARRQAPPDALSETVPIWCAVVNRATRMRGLLARRRTMAGEQEEEEAAVDLHTLPGAVSAHEHAQIAARLDGWATALAVRVVTTGSPATLPLRSTAKNPYPHRIRRMPSRN